MLTPNEAAKKAGVSRPTIMTALNNMVINGIRDNRNRWQIDPESLEEWMKGREKSDTVVSVQADSSEINGLRVEVKVLRELVESQKSEIDFLRETVKANHSRRSLWDFFRKG